MPYSHEAPKDWCLERIAELAPEHVLDVGPGLGAWGRLIYERIGGRVEVDCIEAHGPYVERFNLGAHYANVFVGDVRNWDWGGCDYITVAESDQPVGQGIPKWTWDLVILGDVLEHMTKPEALAVVDQALVHADAVLVVVPLGEWPQGPEEGNPLEAHVSTWEWEDIAALPPGKRLGGDGIYVTGHPKGTVETEDRIAAVLLGAWP